MPDIPFRPYRSRCWRMMVPRWSHAPLGGEGATVRGGRFNRPGLAALYLAETPETAFAEYQQGMFRMPRPGTLVGYEVDVLNMLDLTDESVLSALGIAATVLSCPWKLLRAQKAVVPSWELADRLIADKTACIRAPSFASPAGGNNVVFWSWSAPPDLVTVYDPYDDLPRGRSSWTSRPPR